MNDLRRLAKALLKAYINGDSEAVTAIVDLVCELADDTWPKTTFDSGDDLDALPDFIVVGGGSA